AVDVIGRVAGGVGLDVDEFDLERRALDTIVAAFTLLFAAGPAEANFIRPILLHRFQPLFGHVGWKAIGIFINQRLQRAPLLAGQLLGQNAFGRLGARLRSAGIADFARRLLGDDRLFFLVGRQR